MAGRPSETHGRGRPTELTAAKAQVICDLVRTGMPIVRIAASIGVRPQTISEWRAKGRDGRQPYADFAAAVNAAQADLERECLTNIKAAGLDAKNWTANCWILERLHPQAYAAAYYKVRAKATKAGEMAALKRSMTEALPLDEDGENALVEAICSDPKLSAKVKERLGK